MVLSQMRRPSAKASPLLWQVAQDKRFAMVTDSSKQAAKAAFYRAVDWLLANQVQVKGQLSIQLTSQLTC